MKIKVTIGDNDFNSLMEWSVRYALYHISQCIKLQPRASKITLVRELIEEFLEVMHVDENIRSYVTKRLKVTYAKKMQDWENMEVFYIDAQKEKYKLV